VGEIVKPDVAVPGPRSPVESLRQISASSRTGLKRGRGPLKSDNEVFDRVRVDAGHGGNVQRGHRCAPLTLRLVGIGLLLSWAMALALSAAWLRVSAYDALATIISGTFLCIPAAVLVLLSVLWNVLGALMIALIVFPRVYRYARNLLRKAYSLPHILTARAKGLSELRILFWYVVPVAGPQLLAVAGVSVSTAVRVANPRRSLVRNWPG
jgi:uncharacterized membrane protein